MSRRLPETLIVTLKRAVAGMVLAVLFAAPGFAQVSGGIVGATSVNPKLNDTEVTFPILGAESATRKGKPLRVNAGGAVAGINGTVCPFLAMGAKGVGYSAEGDKLFKAAADAAKQAGEPQGCPYAYNSKGKKFYLSACQQYYDAKSRDPANPDADPNTNIQGCHEDAGEDRDAFFEMHGYLGMKLNTDETMRLTSAKVISEDARLMNAELAKRIREAEEAKEAAKRQCVNASKDRIKNYFLQRQEVLCYQYVKDSIYNDSKQLFRDITRSSDEQLTSALSNLGWTNVGGAIAAAKVPITIAVRIGTAAKDLDRMLSRMNQACGGIVTGLNSLNNLSSSIQNTLSCQAVTNLVERQLTQCIRVNLGVDLSLPQFSLALQCPVNINLSARLGADGFIYNADVSTQSLLAGTGGLDSLFNPQNFSRSTVTQDVTAGTRVPGIDCAAPDRSNVMKNQSLQGTTYLTSGTGSDGWAVGGSETIKSADGTKAIQVTRCDYFEAKRLLRTAYVYGSGASCNSGSSGFLDGGYETNTACYGNYTAASAPSVPDACMYPVGCLDATGKFSQNLVGSQTCSAGVKPVFNAAATYTTMTTGGIGGGDIVSHSCSEFDGKYQAALTCCDPQLQNCANRDANVPLCVCDQGDAQNTIFRDPNTHQLDPNGACVEGGNVTCCSPRLNGQDWCEKNMGAASICADEVADQCVPAGTSGSYTGADGNTRTDITPADLALSRASPYIYLFVRPDYSLGTTQCCTTAWCNVCPQQYANAYGLSLVRSTLSSPPKAIGDYRDSNYDRYNTAILGKGWPFISSTNSSGITSYAAGVNPFPVKYYNPINKDNPLTFNVNNPRLYIGPDIDATLKLSDSAMNACNSLSATKAGYAGDQEFVNGNMGFVFPDYKVKNGGNIGYAQIPTITETPLAYLNRIRSAINSNGQPLPEIKLCSDAIKICTAPVSGLTNGTNEPAVVVTPPVIKTPDAPAPDVVTAPVKTTPTTGGGSGGVAVPTSGPTEVPSAGSGQASQSLY